MTKSSNWYVQQRTRYLNVPIPEDFLTDYPMFKSRRQVAGYIATALPVLLRKTLASMAKEVDRAEDWVKQLEKYLAGLKKKGQDLPALSCSGDFLLKAIDAGKRKWFRSLSVGQRLIFTIWLANQLPDKDLVVHSREIYNPHGDLNNTVVDLPESVCNFHKTEKVFQPSVMAELLRSLPDLQRQAVASYIPEGLDIILQDALMLTEIVEPEIAGEVFLSRVRLMAKRKSLQEYSKEARVLSKLDAFTLFLLELHYTDVPSVANAKTLQYPVGLLNNKYISYFKSPNSAVSILTQTMTKMLNYEMEEMAGIFSYPELNAIIQTLVLNRSQLSECNGHAVVPLLREYLPTRVLVEGVAEKIVAKVDKQDLLAKVLIELLALWVSEDISRLDDFLEMLTDKQ